jgi:hypothetical protein
MAIAFDDECGDSLSSLLTSHLAVAWQLCGLL